MLIRRDENEIDKLFRQSLQHAEEEVPAHLWEGVRAASSTRKRIFPWWMWSVACLGLVLAGWSYFQYSKPEATATLPSQEQVSSVDSGNEINSEGTGSKPTPSTQTDSTTPPTSEPRVENPSNVSEPQSSVQKLEIKRDQASTKRGSFYEHASKTSQASNGTIQDPSKPDSGIGTTSLLSPPITQDSTILPSDENTTQKQLIEPQTSDVVLNEEYFAAVKDSTDSLQRTPGAMEDYIGKGDISLLTTTPALSPKQKGTSPWSLNAYTGYYQNYRKLFIDQPSADTSALLADAAPAINTPVNPSRGVAVGLGVQYDILPMWYVGTGVEFNRMKETTHFQNYYARKEASYAYYNDTTTVITGTDTLWAVTAVPVLIDSVWNAKSESAKLTNTFSTVSVPIFTGFKWQKNKFSIGAEAGVVVRVARVYQGYFRFDDQLVESEISLVPPGISDYQQPIIDEGRAVYTQDIYTTWKMDFHTALRFGYALNERLNAGIALQYRWSKPIQHSDVVKHSMLMPGLQVGIQYRL